MIGASSSASSNGDLRRSRALQQLLALELAEDVVARCGGGAALGVELVDAGQLHGAVDHALGVLLEPGRADRPARPRNWRGPRPGCSLVQLCAIEIAAEEFAQLDGDGERLTIGREAADLEARAAFELEHVP